MDSVLIENLREEAPVQSFKGKDWTYSYDLNAGVYSSNQIQYDFASLSNSGYYIDWSDGFLVIPIQMTATSTGALGDLPNSACFKNGYFHLINSIQIQVDGIQVNNPCQNINSLISFKLMNEMSQQTEKLWGATLGLSKDTSKSARYAPVVQATVAASAGAKSVVQGESNCNSFSTGQFSWIADKNLGSLERADFIKFESPTVAAATNVDQASAVGGLQDANNNNSKAVARNYSSNAANVQTWNFLGVIRLKDIHPFFAALDFPCKGLHPILQININASSTSTILCTTGGGANTPLLFSATTVSPFPTFPAMMLDNGLNTLTNGQTITLKVEVGKGLMNQSRIYVPIIQLDASLSLSLAKGLKRRVEYLDSQFFSFSNQPAGGDLSLLVSNGISNLKRITFIPFISVNASQTLSPYASPFSTAPATSSPYVNLTNIQLMIGGVSYYRNIVSYDFEEFIENVRSMTLNGGQTDELASGLISQFDWENNYRYYTFDVSRMPMAISPDVPQSVQFNCRNNSQVAIDLWCFCEYSKSIELDMAGGRSLVA